jgi:hypothetical protein
MRALHPRVTGERLAPAGLQVAHRLVGKGERASDPPGEPGRRFDLSRLREASLEQRQGLADRLGERLRVPRVRRGRDALQPLVVRATDRLDSGQVLLARQRLAVAEAAADQDDERRNPRPLL